MSVEAVVMAGGRSWGGAPCRALFPLNGKPMVLYVLDALQNSGIVSQIYITGPAEALRKAIGLREGIEIIEQGETLMQNIELGLLRMQDSEKLALICSADQPFLTSEAVRDFVMDAQRTQAELIYCIVAKEVVEAAYPDTKRTYIRMREGKVTGGNVSMCTPALYAKNRETALALTENRKNAVKLALTLGLGTLFGMAFGIAPLSKVEKAGSKLLGGRVAAIWSKHACIGQDVDKQEDVELAEKLLAMSAQ